MKRTLIIKTFILFIALSCNLDRTDEKSFIGEKFLFKKIQPYGNALVFFENECLEKLEEALVRYDVWPKNAKIIEACSIVFDEKVLKLENRNLGNKNLIFLGFLYSVNENRFSEFYMYDKDFGDFTPLRFVGDELYQDSIFLVRLYLNKGVSCGDIELKGTNTDDYNKNGVFRIE